MIVIFKKKEKEKITEMDEWKTVNRRSHLKTNKKELRREINNHNNNIFIMNLPLEVYINICKIRVFKGYLPSARGMSSVF